MIEMLVYCARSSVDAENEDTASQRRFWELVKDVQASFLQQEPEAVTDGHWGDYMDAELVFKNAPIDWPADYVFEHRSIIGFVNDAGFLFLVPHFVQASYIAGEIKFDVLEYLVSELKFRIHTDKKLFSAKQRTSLEKALRFLEGRVVEWGADAAKLVQDIGEIRNNLILNK